MKTKIETIERDNEVIKQATKADASIQKANIENRKGTKGLISENIKTKISLILKTETLSIGTASVF